MPANNRSGHPGRRAAAAQPKKKTVAPEFSFDDWTRDEAVETFKITIGGKQYESLDPMDIDYRDLGEAVKNEDPADLFRVLFPDGAEEILENTISVGALFEFNEAVVIHFGLEDFIAAQS